MSIRRWVSQGLCLWLLALGSAQAAGPAPKLRGIKVHLPGVRQATSYTCGVASTQAILLHYDKGGDWGEGPLARQLKANTKTGTYPSRIVRHLNASGLKATMHKRMTIASLKRALDKRQPVIVNLQAWSDRTMSLRDYRQAKDDGHYVVAIGYRGKTLLFMDPSIGGARGKLTSRELLARWHDVDAIGRKVYSRMGIVVESPTPPVNLGYYSNTLHID